jgi:hypothetical protein
VDAGKAPPSRVWSEGRAGACGGAGKKENPPPSRPSSEGGGGGVVGGVEKGKEPLRLAFGAREGPGEWWWVVVVPD